MTRREEIEYSQRTKEFLNKPLCINTAIEWADKTMIEKICDWFQCMALDYMQGDITDVKWESMFVDLRNYIENGDD